MRELTDAVHRAEYLENDNSRLYAEVADLRASSAKVADFDACCRALSATETALNELRQDRATCEEKLKMCSAQLVTAHHQIEELCNINKDLQAELKHLQERSMLCLLFHQ